MSSPYGLLRSPWNYNPSPLLTRYGDVFQIADPSVIGPVIQNVYRMHSGVMCSDYSMFFSVVKEAPLETFLLTIEDGTHGALHFTYGGVGGDVSMAVVKVLREEFGFTTSNIIALAQSAQPYNKKALALSFDSPLNCTTIPWQDYTLTSTASPAERGGPHCDFDESYYSNDTTLNNLVDAFYIADLDPDDKVRTRLKNMEFKERSRAMKIVANMFPYDGDLAGAGAGRDGAGLCGMAMHSSGSTCHTALNISYAILVLVAIFIFIYLFSLFSSLGSILQQWIPCSGCHTGPWNVCTRNPCSLM